MGGALGSGGGSTGLGIVGPTNGLAIAILSGSFTLIASGGAAETSNSERVPPSTSTVFSLASKSRRKVGSMFAVSTFLGFNVGRNSRVPPAVCCTTRNDDRPTGPCATAGEEAAKGERLTTGVELEPPPGLLL